MFIQQRTRNGFIVRKDRALLIIGMLFGVLLTVDLAVVVSAWAELPAPAGSKAPSSHQRKASKKVPEKGRPLADEELKKYQYCGGDQDCTVAINGCCDCANGGADVSVSKERLMDFNSRFECKGKACTKKAAMPECGSGVVSCVNHQCKYFTAADFERQ